MSDTQQRTLQTPEECRTRLAELRSDFTDIPAEDRTDDQDSRVAAIIDEVNMLDARIDTLEVFERREHPPTSLVGTQDHAGLPMEYRSGGERVVQSDEWAEWESRGFSLPPVGRDGHPGAPGLSMSLNCSISDFERRVGIAEFGTSGPGYAWGAPGTDTSNAGMLLPVGQPIAPLPRQAKLYLRDLMPVASTTLASIPYVQELNAVTNEAGATSVAEGSTKPSATIAFQGAKADPTVIATTLTLSKQLFADAPAVIQYLNSRLPYLVKFREDWEILNGNANWPDMVGLVNEPGLGAPVTSPGSSDIATTLGNAFAQIEVADGAVTAVVMHPTDAWKMFTNRASTSGVFDVGTPFASLPMNVWGVPTYRTRAKAQGTAVVGDFQRGGQLFDREQINVQVYQERYAELNQVLLICEERLGVAWYRPDLFTLATV